MLETLLLGAALILGQPAPYSQPPAPVWPEEAEDVEPREEGDVPDDHEAPPHIAFLTDSEPGRPDFDDGADGLFAQVEDIQLEAEEEEPKAEQEPPEPEPEPGADRWFLMKAAQGTYLGEFFNASRITVYGWTEGSYPYNPDGQTDSPILFQNPTNEFLLNQNFAIIDRPIDPASSSSTFGFRSEWLIGTDARFTQQRGLLNGQQNMVQIDPYQFYLEGQLPFIARGMNIKIGRMGVPFGAELTENVYNAQYSRSYAFNYNPFTHTGIATTFKLTDIWSIGLWATLGNDVWFDPAAKGMYLLVLYFTAPNGRDSAVTSFCVSGDNFDVEEQFSNQNMADLVYTHAFTGRFRYQAHCGYSWETGVPGSDFVNWYWFVNYLIYDMSDKVSLAGRLEFFDDAQGFRTGFEGLYTAATAGFICRPRRSLLLRPEIRFDYNDESRPFNNHKGMLMLACDFILRW